MQLNAAVEQRCARIRGRMVWILSQLDVEDEGDSILMELGHGSESQAFHTTVGAFSELRAQQEVHERELEDELKRQAALLRSEHNVELEDIRAQLAAQQASELSAAHSEVAAAKDAAHTALLSGQSALRDAKLDAECQRGALDACHRAELGEVRNRVTALEACLREISPLLLQAAGVLPLSDLFAPKLKVAIDSFEALIPGSTSPTVPSADSSSTIAAVAASSVLPQRTELPTLPKVTPATTVRAVPAKPTLGADVVAGALPASSSSSSDPKLAHAPYTNAAPRRPEPKPAAKAATTPAFTSPTATPPAASAPAGDAPGPPPPSRGLCLVPVEVEYTHPGGSKPLDAKNQDTYFTLKIDAHNAAWGVLDGHGGDNGTLVARVAANTIRDYLKLHFYRLRTEPEAVFKSAFEKAHEASRQAVLSSDPNLQLMQGVPVDSWEEESGEVRLEAADGGTTATIIALLDGATLVHAQVGDSSALLGGMMSRDDGNPGEVAFEELMEEHSATNAREYARVLSTGPRGKLLNFVYDVPELIDQGKVNECTTFKVLGTAGGMPELNVRAKRQAEVYGVPAKNARGDLPTILLTPDDDKDYVGMEPQSLAMTRSIGDFYMHTFGVSWQPEVISVDLAEQCAELDHLTLIMCSDGIWDLWEYDEVFQAILSPPERNVQSIEAARLFFDKSVTQGAELFEDTADNMTGIVIYLNPEGVDVIQSPRPTKTKHGGATANSGKAIPKMDSTFAV